MTRSLDLRLSTPRSRQVPPPAGGEPLKPSPPDAAIASQSALDDLPLNRRHLAVFALCGAGLFFESTNLQLMSLAAPLIAREWRIGPSMMGLVISSTMLGMLVGTYLFSALADRVGRRPIFQLTVALFSVLTALCSFSGAIWQLAALRFGAGLGIGGSIPVETAVLAEFTPSRWRSRILALWAMALPVGALVAPLCVALMPVSMGWRGLFFLGGGPALLVLVLRRTVPESPAYLLASGRCAEASRAASWIAGRPLRLERSPAPSPAMTKEGPARLFAPDQRASTMASWLLYFSSFFAYYGYVLWLPGLLTRLGGFDKIEALGFVASVAVSGLLGRLAVLAASNFLSDRWLMAICAFGGMIALAAFALQSDHRLLLAWACAAGFSLEGVFSVLIPLVASLHPAAMRATGVGWAAGMGRIGMALAPLAMGLLMQSGAREACLLLAAVAGLTGLISFFMLRLPTARVEGSVAARTSH